MNPPAKHAVILAGGSGERFWPASTPERPKQLLALLSSKTMLRETTDRLDGIVPPERRLVLTARRLADAVARECPEIPRAHVIGEPEAKNTAPAIGLAAGLLAARDPEALLLVLPADHAVGDPAAFRESVEAAFRIGGEESAIVLFGVVPTRPETGYGYIERGEPVSDGGAAYRVARFREKPDRDAARAMAADGRHYWNSGIFCAPARVFLEEYDRHLPAMRRAIDAAADAWSEDREGALERYYAAVESISIDYGVLQRSDRAVVLPADGWRWDDVGSWEALARWIEPSEEGNVAVGDCALEGCRGVIAYAESGKIAALGLTDCVVVRTGGETLVAARDRLDDLRSFVRSAAAQPGPEAER